MKKSISPLLATVIIIAFTVTFAILALNWLSSLSQSEMEKSEKHASVSCAHATFSVEETVHSGNQLKMKIKADGKERVEIEKIILVNSSHVTQTFFNGQNFSLSTLSPGEVGYVVLSGILPNITEVQIIPAECKMNSVLVTEDEIAEE